MIPILYESNTTSFDSNGIGRLSDAVTCIVTEVRNGQYELQMTYPMDGELYDNLQVSRIIWAVPSDGENEQAFRIYKVTRPISGIVTVYAEHISYQLSCVPVTRYSATSAAAAMSGLSLHAAVECPFSFWTDLTTSGNFSVDVPSGIRSVLGGTEGSVLDTFGGEYEWDNYVVRLHAHRGADNGITIRYGKNITDLKQEENITNTITGVYPYWKDSEGNYTELNQKVVLSSNASNFPYPRVVIVDCSQEFGIKPTQQQLLEWANEYISRAGIGIPSVSIDVSFVALWQTEQYKNIAPLERVKLCDIVTVEYEKLGVSAKAKVISTEYDVLAERYNSIGIGNAKSTLTEQFLSQQQQLNNQQSQINEKPSESFMKKAIENATNWINNVNGGYVVLHKNANEQPYEILIMDTPDIETAKRVWKWNQGGLGYSDNGYKGPYKTAITQDGAIVADFITAGTMLANIIKGGTLTLGGGGNGNGICQILNESGKVIVKIDNTGIDINAGSIDVYSDNDENVVVQCTSAKTNPNGTVTKRKTVITPMGIRIYVQDDASGTKNVMILEAGSIRAGTFSGTIDNPGAIAQGSYMSASRLMSGNGVSGSFSDGSGNDIRVKSGIITSI